MALTCRATFSGPYGLRIILFGVLVSDNSSTDSECTILEASSVASDQDRFDAAYEAFRDLSADLYDIDTRQYARGVTSDDAWSQVE